MTRAEQLAAESLRLLCANDLTAGFRTYAQALRTPGGHDLPAAWHAGILTHAKLPDAANRVMSLAYEAGGDPCAVPLLPTTSPQEILAGYDQWFARDCATPAMVAHAMVWLSRAGAASRLASLVAQKDLLSVEALPEGTICLEDLAACLSRPEHLHHTPAMRSGRDLSRIPDLHLATAPPVVALHALVLERAQLYLDRVRALGHLMSPHLPTRTALKSWANLSDGRGYHTPHIHTGCWVVAVVYVHAPSLAVETCEGCLRIGPAPGGDPDCPGWPRAQIPPRPGTLVLMPSFYTHWTTPYRPGADRLSIAFNVCDADGQFAGEE